MLASAILLASNLHSMTLTPSGNPFILHPLRVMLGLASEDEELMTIAVLKDVIQESHYDLTDLQAMGYSSRVTTALDYLHREEHVAYEDHIETMLFNDDAVLVEIATIEDLLKNETDVESIQRLRKALNTLRNENLLTHFVTKAATN